MKWSTKSFVKPYPKPFDVLEELAKGAGLEEENAKLKEQIASLQNKIATMGKVISRLTESKKWCIVFKDNEEVKVIANE